MVALHIISTKGEKLYYAKCLLHYLEQKLIFCYPLHWLQKVCCEWKFMAKFKLACLEEHILLSYSLPEMFRTRAVLAVIAIQTKECVSLKQTKCMCISEAESR